MRSHCATVAAIHSPEPFPACEMEISYPLNMSSQLFSSSPYPLETTTLFFVSVNLSIVPSVVAYVCHPSTLEAKAEGLQIRTQPG